MYTRQMQTNHQHATKRTRLVATKAHPVWPTIISEDNSGDVEVVPSVGGAVGAEELTAANAPTGQNRFVFTASDASGNTASCGAIFGLW